MVHYYVWFSHLPHVWKIRLRSVGIQKEEEEEEDVKLSSDPLMLPSIVVMGLSGMDDFNWDISVDREAC